MTTKSDKASISTQQAECLHLRKFKCFLREVAVGGLGENASSASEQRNCMRNNSETYPVTKGELKGELISYIWNQLQTKQCPTHFQLSVLHTILAEIGSECQNTKDNDFIQTTSNKESDAESNNEVQYDLVKLQKFIANNLEKFLTRLTDNAEAANLCSYADEGVICQSTHDCQCSYSSETTPKRYVVGCIKNKPRKMEDRFVCLERYSKIYDLKSHYSFYGVFDGHSGPLAANYATCHIPFLLAKQLKMSHISSPDDYRLAFEAAFLQANEQFSQKCISSGTTAVCALILESAPISHLYIAWVGDSRALLVGSETSLQLVKSHKPDSPEERKRIEDAGGTVMHVQGQWRVNGFLNVARSIGDYSVSAVIAEPDFVDVPLTKNYDFLVLATDGLWDHVSEATIITTIYSALEDQKQDVADIPKQLIDLAKEGDSQDNITVVIVFLKERVEILKQRDKQNDLP